MEQPYLQRRPGNGIFKLEILLFPINKVSVNKGEKRKLDIKEAPSNASTCVNLWFTKEQIGHISHPSKIPLLFSISTEGLA